MMAKFRMVRTEFWKNPHVSEEMTPEDRYFYLYLLTNPYTTQIGIYTITKKQMAFDLGYSIESVQSLVERFTSLHKLIRYNPETREIGMKNWGKDNIHKGGKPVIDCMISEMKEVEDRSLIPYVAESIHKEELRRVYESFLKLDGMDFDTEGSDEEENDPSIMEDEEADDTFSPRSTIRGQKEQQEEKEQEKQQQQEHEKQNKKQQQQIGKPNTEGNPDRESPLETHQRVVDVKEIIQFWDNNGFGLSNINGKEQLLCWLDDSRFLQPKAVILKAMQIACANNKRMLNYVSGILKNWENESLLTVEEIDGYQQSHHPEQKSKPATVSTPVGRAIPGEFTLDLTAGEES